MPKSSDDESDESKEHKENEEKKRGEEKEKQEYRERIDVTDDLRSGKRRLDSLAYLLASESMCVSVSMVNGKLYISANEIYKKKGLRSGEERKKIKTEPNNHSRLQTMLSAIRAEIKRSAPFCVKPVLSGP